VRKAHIYKLPDGQEDSFGLHSLEQDRETLLILILEGTSYFGLVWPLE
jgi:hypothetical protein